MPLLDGALLIAPVAALAATAGLVVLLRRAAEGERSETTARDNDGGGYGLLRTAATTRDLVDAELVRAHLASAGIRSTLATDLNGRIRVLVFADELDRARRLAG